MATITVEIDSDAPHTVHDIAQAIEGILGLLPEQSLVTVDLGA